MKATHRSGAAQVERFIIGPGFSLPELTAIEDIDWVEHADPFTVTSTYVDTADQQLARRGLTVHHERVNSHATWFVTSPSLDCSKPIRHVPDADLSTVALALSGLIGDRGLSPQMTLTTLRQSAVAHDEDGECLATINIDQVAAAMSGNAARRRSWDEMSVDSADPDRSGLAAQLRRRLTDRGALPSDGASRVEQLLAVQIPDRPRKLAGLIHDYLTPQFDCLLVNDILLRAGDDVTHETRLAARRVLSVLRVMAEAFETEQARALARDLIWFSDLLGAVADCQTRRRRLRRVLTSAHVSAAHLAGQEVVKEQLDLERDLATLALRDGLGTDRYAGLAAQMAQWRAELPLTAAARRLKRKSVRRYLDRAEVELEWRLGALHEVPSDLAMHSARQAARRTRFIAELALPALGKAARLSRADAVELQDRLGEHRDAVITADVSRRLAKALDGSARQLLMSVYAEMDHEVELARDRSLRVTVPR